MIYCVYLVVVICLLRVVVFWNLCVWLDCLVFTVCGCVVVGVGALLDLFACLTGCLVILIFVA